MPRRRGRRRGRSAEHPQGGPLWSEADRHPAVIQGGEAPRESVVPGLVLRLYRAPYSTNVERVALALAYKGLAVESVVIDYGDRSAVQRISGQPLVPVLDDDGTIVVDSMEIVRHLEARWPDPPLYPADEP